MSYDILMKQNPSSSNWLSEKKHAPTWGFTQPTPELEQKGLSWAILRETIEAIDSMAESAFEEQYDTTYKALFYIALAGSGIGCIVTVASVITHNTQMSKIGGLAASAAMLVCIIFSFMAGKKYNEALSGAMSVVQNHVENVLNEEWQSARGVRWSIVTERTVNTTGSGSQSGLNTLTWHHIAVTAVKSEQELANQRRPAAVVMVPVQPQYVQSVAEPLVQPVPQAAPYIPNDAQVNRYEPEASDEEEQPFVPKQYSEGDKHVTDQ